MIFLMIGLFILKFSASTEFYSCDEVCYGGRFEESKINI